MQVGPPMIDAILALVAIEFLVLSAFLARARAKGLIAPLFFFLASGALLLAAFRFSLAEADARVVSACLALAMVSHIATLALVAQRIWPRG